MINEVFARRFGELEQSYGQLDFKSNGGGMAGSYVRAGEWQRWATSAQNLILAVFGETSPHYTNFVQALKDCSGYDHSVRTLE